MQRYAGAGLLRIPGNVGMLGQDYDGYFALGDAAGLAQLLLLPRRMPQPQGAVCADPAPMCPTRTLFAPAAEAAAAGVARTLHAGKPKLLMKAGSPLSLVNMAM